MIFSAVVSFVSFLNDQQKISYLISSLFFAFTGVYQITNGLGLERSWLRTGENFIIVKWRNMFNQVQIHDTRIARIQLTRSKILIFQKSIKPLKLNLGFLEREQKKEIYEFLIEYAKKKNLELVRDF